MTLANQVLAVNDDLPIRTQGTIHSGKVRSVYWLTDEDSRRLIESRGYPVPLDTSLAVMVISDRISAFDCIWQGKNGLNGVPGKGAALNCIANHWFEQFKEHGLAPSHILEAPHPLVWIVQKARPIKIEAICRQYITGSMWRAYDKGERNFCGIQLPEGLTQDSKLLQLLLTPSTKGILRGLPDIPEADDVNISRQNIESNYQAFNFNSPKDIDLYEQLLIEGFHVISGALEKTGQIFVDTKFEFGYVKDSCGQDQLIYMDEVGTPDSSRIWNQSAYENGQIVENSKEGFRQFLLQYFEDSDILLNKNRMNERIALAQNYRLPQSVMMDLSKTYLDLAETITGKTIHLSANPREEIINVLSETFDLIED